jgi:hypothetical protein
MIRKFDVGQMPLSRRITMFCRNRKAIGEGSFPIANLSGFLNPESPASGTKPKS